MAAADRAVLNLIDDVKVHGLRALPWNHAAHMPHTNPTIWSLDSDEEVEVVITATAAGGDRHWASQPVASGELLTCRYDIHFQAKRRDGSPLPTANKVDWRVTNAPDTPQPHGGFYPQPRDA